MQHLLVGLALLFTSMCFSQKTATPLESSYSITATVVNVSSNQGKVHFALYDSPENFRNRKRAATLTAVAKDGKSSVTFKNIIAGEYAIVCYHDENNNNRLDSEGSGIPTEDYGATNNVMNFGPPQFGQAKFELTNKDLTFEIKF